MTKFEHWDFLKLYTKEENAFADLPVYTRALAAELLKFADKLGRIYVGPGDEYRPMMRRMGAHRGDRRGIPADVKLLIDDGYLFRDGEFLVIKNFKVAQRRRGKGIPDVDVPEPDAQVPDGYAMGTLRYPMGTVADQYPTSSGPVADQYPTTQVPDGYSNGGASTRNHSEADRSPSRARARGSDPSRAEPSKSRADARALAGGRAGGREGKPNPPNADEVMAEIKKHPSLRDALLPQVAREVESHAMAKGTPAAWIATAIAEAGQKAHDAELAGEALPKRTVVSMVTAFSRRAGPPRESRPMSRARTEAPAPPQPPIVKPSTAPRVPAAEVAAGAAAALQAIERARSS